MHCIRAFYYLFLFVLVKICDSDDFYRGGVKCDWINI